MGNTNGRIGLRGRTSSGDINKTSRRIKQKHPDNTIGTDYNQITRRRNENNSNCTKYRWIDKKIKSLGKVRRIIIQ